MCYILVWKNQNFFNFKYNRSKLYNFQLKIKSFNGKTSKSDNFRLETCK